MKVGARIGFPTMRHLESRFKGVDFPVELALPYRVNDFLLIKDRMEEVRDFIRAKRVEFV